VFTGNDFSQAVLKNVDFRDIDLAAQHLPSEFQARGTGKAGGPLSWAQVTVARPSEDPTTKHL
jgi:hypothetical protein